MNKKNYRTGSNQSYSRPRKIVMLGFLFLIVAFTIVTILEKTRVTDFIKLHPAPSSSSNAQTQEQKDQQDAQNAEKKKQSTTNDKDATGSTDATVTPVTSIDVRAETAGNSSVTIFTTLRGYSDGTCLLTITNAGKSTTQSAKVIYQPEASSCAGFSVPIDPIGKGTWNINLSVTSNGVTNSKDISYEVK